ncbi:hypothetical protein [Rhodobacter ferrooxidans]|uniref:Uncharacterized protein n=1 Tax=Rhodobacter ferrooxidans TaxID=371731 RepID=C8RYY0_9RHOB|nr:hypothetical protein [Rhodobacter sp. SW2]EEW25937.1 hypothetical protein Rsw2DRAFT_1008 [Rhodobacter sp. SW2]
MINPTAFGPADIALLTRLGALSEDLRGIACTLARLGVRWRRAEPARCAGWIDAVEPHPFYKLGQVMFDLLEWEDFMLDEAAPPASAQRLLDVAGRLLAQAGVQITQVTLPADLPPLEAGFYLYRDVVLGLIWLAITGVPGN